MKQKWAPARHVQQTRRAAGPSRVPDKKAMLQVLQTSSDSEVLSSAERYLSSIVASLLLSSAVFP